MKPRPNLFPASLVLLALGFVLLPAAGQTPKPAPPPAKSSNLNDLSLEIAALQTFHELGLTAEQLNALGKLARESTSKGEQRQPAKTSPELASALVSLHAAYVKGDDNQISDCQEKLDSLMEKQQPELDNSVVITEGGRSNAADALKLLNVRQVGALLGTLEMTDPVELLVTAQEQVRQIKKSDDLTNEIATVAEEVAWLLHGWDDDEASQKTKDKVTALLEGTANRPGGVSSAERKRWEKDARQAIGEYDAKDVIGHIMEHGMAELLSNPRVEAAIRTQTRLALRPPTTRTPTTPAKKPAK